LVVNAESLLLAGRDIVTRAGVAREPRFFGGVDRGGHLGIFLRGNGPPVDDWIERDRSLV